MCHINDPDSAHCSIHERWVLRPLYRTAEDCVCMCVWGERQRAAEREYVWVLEQRSTTVFSAPLQSFFLDSRRAVGAFARSRLKEGSLLPQRRRRGQVFILNLAAAWLLGYAAAKTRPTENRPAQVRTRQTQLRDEDLSFIEPMLALGVFLFMEARTGQRGQWCLTKQVGPLQSLAPDPSSPLHRQYGSDV